MRCKGRFDPVAVFANATVHGGKPDVDFFMDRSNAAKSRYDVKYFDEAVTTLKPHLGAGKVKAFAATEEILPGFTATLHPGHTPGSAFYTLPSAEQRIVFVGDIIHVSSVQFPEPAITITYDVDPKTAGKVRAEEFPAFAGDRELIAAPHLPFPGVGHIRTAGHGFAWALVNYGNREIKYAVLQANSPGTLVPLDHSLITEFGPRAFGVESFARPAEFGGI